MKFTRWTWNVANSVSQNDFTALVLLIPIIVMIYESFFQIKTVWKWPNFHVFRPFSRKLPSQMLSSDVIYWAHRGHSWPRLHNGYNEYPVMWLVTRILSKMLILFPLPTWKVKSLSKTIIALNFYIFEVNSRLIWWFFMASCEWVWP